MHIKTLPDYSRDKLRPPGACENNKITDLLNQLEQNFWGVLLLVFITSIINFRNKKVNCHFKGRHEVKSSLH